MLGAAGAVVAERRESRVLRAEHIFNVDVYGKPFHLQEAKLQK